MLSLEKRGSMGEQSNTVGTTLEELLRHHPELSEPCIPALIDELKIILAIIDEYQGLTLEDSISSHPLANNNKFTTILYFAKGVLNCFESLLTKKETVALFDQLDGIDVLARLLRVAHKPARYIVASFSCSTDPSTHSLGHYPIVKVIQRIIIIIIIIITVTIIIVINIFFFLLFLGYNKMLWTHCR